MNNERDTRDDNGVRTHDSNGTTLDTIAIKLGQIVELLSCIEHRQQQSQKQKRASEQSPSYSHDSRHAKRSRNRLLDRDRSLDRQASRDRSLGRGPSYDRSLDRRASRDRSLGRGPSRDRSLGRGPSCDRSVNRGPSCDRSVNRGTSVNPQCSATLSLNPSSDNAAIVARLYDCGQNPYEAALRTRVLDGSKCESDDATNIAVKVGDDTKLAQDQLPTNNVPILINDQPNNVPTPIADKHLISTDTLKTAHSEYDVNRKITLRGVVSHKHLPLVSMQLDCFHVTQLQSETLAFVSLEQIAEQTFCCAFVENSINRPPSFSDDGFTNSAIDALEPTRLSEFATRVAVECTKTVNYKPWNDALPCVVISHSHFGSFSESDTHTPMMTMVFLCLDGSGTFHFHDMGKYVEHSIQPGSCFMFSQRRRHYWKSNTDRPLTVLAVGWRGKFMDTKNTPKKMHT